MGWMTQLYKTYENLTTNKELLQKCPTPLLPLSHTIQTAHVEMIISGNGDLIRAYDIPKSDALTITPCTEDSAARSNGIFPHMLYDNLKYVAGDACTYKSDKKLRDSYDAYCKQLKEWCDCEACLEDVRAIYKYIVRGSIISDLIDKAVLIMKNGKLAWNGASDNKPADVFSTFIRFRVERDGRLSLECNANTKLMKAYEEFDRSKYKDVRLCFVSGEDTPVTYKHASKIRYSGDSARLISANDSSGYTFRGRFRNKEDAFAVGYEVSQKAHSALRWLIANQGYTTGPQTVIAWAVDTKNIPSPLLDTFVLFPKEMEIFDKYDPLGTYAENLRNALKGYKHNDLYEPMEANNIVVMILEGATPGRLSITYYREFSNNDYIDNIEYWHNTCVWNHSYKIVRYEKDQEDGRKKEEIKHVKFTGAPSVSDIIYAAYGSRVDDKVKKHLTEILISCVADKRMLPHDIMMKAVERITNPAGMEDWEIEKTTSIACALIKKFYHDKYKEEYSMALDYENRDRSYLFGRVLAYAERIEDYAQHKADDRRVPNARKLRSKFRAKPARTLMILDDKLEPYVEKLYTEKNRMYTQMQEVISLINSQDFMNDTPLEPTYLLGYACQMSELWNNLKKKEEIQEENKKEQQ